MHGVVCIGRNIHGMPMSEARWRRFVLDTCEMVRRHGSTIHNEAIGIGYWENETEDTFVVTFSDCDDTLEEDLAILAVLYEQEAIALILGPAVLVGRHGTGREREIATS